MVGKILTNRISCEKFEVMDYRIRHDGVPLVEVKLCKHRDRKFSNWLTFEQLKGMFHLSKADEILYGK